MLARHHRLFLTAVFLLDGILVAASWLGAYALRFRALGLPAPRGVPPVEPYLWFGALLAALALLVLRSLDLYRSARTARLSRDLVIIVQGITITTALGGLASYFTRGELARSVLLLFAVLATLLLGASRLAIRSGLRQLRRRGRNLRHVLVVGTGGPAATLVRKIRGQPDYGLAIEGLVTADAAEVGTGIEGVQVTGTISELPRLVERHGAEIVYLALERARHEAEHAALERLKDSTVAVRLVPDLASAFTLNASVEDFDGTPVVLVTESPGGGWDGVIKRAGDLVFSLAALVLLSPLLLAIALWVRLDSPGPALYVQERVGLSGRRFRMLKFRTMRPDAEAGGPAWAKADDPRCTRAGRVLRRLSLDELPQLWNVLVGEMSLVGPRPERPVFVDRFRASLPRYMLRHHMRAGLTGWAQVNGLRGDTPLDRRIEYDLYYVLHWSLAFDLKILLLTLARMFRDESAS